MDIGRALNFLQLWQRERVLIVDGDAVLVHDVFCDGVVLCRVANDSAFGTFRDWRRRSPDQLCFSLLQTGDELAKICFVSINGNLLVAARCFRVGEILTGSFRGCISMA